jgi:hypothetical protein
VLLTDSQQPVKVSLCLDDWAQVMFALATAEIPAATRLRINDEIFRCARQTARVLT